MSNLKELLNKKEIVIVCGSGGVGKTTMTALLGLYSAHQGKKTLILTIDPARRLAGALGVEMNVGEICETHFDSTKLPLYTMMLDPYKTVKRILDYFSINNDLKEKLIHHNYFEQMLHAVCGSPEFLSIVELYNLYKTKSFDQIILDTPPTKHALNFFKAPKNLINILDEKKLLYLIFRSLFKFGKFSLNVFSFSKDFILKIFTRIVDKEFLEDFIEFAEIFQNLLDEKKIKEESQKILELLTSEHTGLLLVTTPTPIAINEAQYFYEIAHKLNFKINGVIINRVAKILEDTSSVGNFLENVYLTKDNTTYNKLTHGLIRIFKDYEKIIKNEEHSISKIKHFIAPDTIMHKIPYISDEIVCLDGLKKLMEFV